MLKILTTKTRRKTCLTIKRQKCRRLNWIDSDEMQWKIKWAWTKHWEVRIKRHKKAETDIETDTQEREYTAVTFMINYFVQFNSNLDGPLRENRVRGRVFDRCVNVLLLPQLWSLHHSHKPRHHLFTCLGRHGATEGTWSQRCDSAHTIAEGRRATAREQTCTRHNTHTQCPTHTLWLSELVEHHNVMRVVEVLSQGVDLLTG